MLTCPAAKFTMAAGIKNGEYLARAAFQQLRMFSFDDVEAAHPGADVHSYPMLIFGPICNPDIFTASSAAASARWMKRPIFFTSFFR